MVKKFDGRTNSVGGAIRRHNNWAEDSVPAPQYRPHRRHESWWVTSSDEQFTEKLKEETPRLRQTLSRDV